MNYWTEKSIEIANEGDYLDRLYNIYPMANNECRNIAPDVIDTINRAIEDQDDTTLISYLLKQELFPIKDSYVAYLRKDSDAILRNPEIVNRITDRIYGMGAEEVIRRIREPKETNRQMGPLFNNWLKHGELGINLVETETALLENKADCVFIGSDQAKMEFAHKYLGYNRKKGLDFLARINDIYIMGEAKFLTDFGGHQNAQFDDALSTMRTKLGQSKYKVLLISILDGVLYIKSRNKMFTRLEDDLTDDEIVLSAVLLSDFIEDVKVNVGAYL